MRHATALVAAAAAFVLVLVPARAAVDVRDSTGTLTAAAKADLAAMPSGFRVHVVFESAASQAALDGPAVGTAAP
jgi:hypothetical protein